MAWLDAYLDKCPGFAWQGAPEWNTTVIQLRNKRSWRMARWSQPRWKFSIRFNNNFPEHYQQVLDIHSVCRGRKHFFRVRNWLNYKADDWKFGVGDGIEQEFQLGRLIEVDGESVLIEVHALSLADDAPTPEVKVNGVVAPATFNDRTGMVRFDSPPGVGAELTWSGYFDYWVAFASDDLPASIDTRSGDDLLTNFVAELEEVEPPDEGFSS